MFHLAIEQECQRLVFVNEDVYWNTVEFLTVNPIRTIDVMDFIFESLSNKYKQLQKEVNELKKDKLISDDEHDEVTKVYEERRTQEARILLTSR